MNFNPNKNEIEFVNNALEKFNNMHVGPDNHVLLNIVEYDENQNVIAGILGGTYWGWLHIDILWVDKNFRSKKIGSRLLIAAENEAKKRGCHSVHVDTMSWQAPEFYKKHGYELISELDNIPNGYKKFHFIKRLNV
ncbi:MAG: GNAT family N-acetyltransferase [Spirochaetaceae bacterium]|nr:GNAT family N-acetyltransferase [Spirochaetaceae bacterium]